MNILNLNFIGVKNLERKIRGSFLNAKMDVDNLKQSMSDWIIFLDHNQRDMKERIKVLEDRLRRLEKLQTEKAFDVA